MCVKSIGVSNFSIKKLELLLSKASIPPAVNQVSLFLLHCLSDQCYFYYYLVAQLIKDNKYKPIAKHTICSNNIFLDRDF